MEFIVQVLLELLLTTVTLPLVLKFFRYSSWLTRALIRCQRAEPNITALDYTHTLLVRVSDSDADYNNRRRLTPSSSTLRSQLMFICYLYWLPTMLLSLYTILATGRILNLNLDMSEDSGYQINCLNRGGWALFVLDFIGIIYARKKLMETSNEEFELLQNVYLFPSET